MKNKKLIHGYAVARLHLIFRALLAVYSILGVDYLLHSGAFGYYRTLDILQGVIA